MNLMKLSKQNVQWEMLVARRGVWKGQLEVAALAIKKRNPSQNLFYLQEKGRKVATPVIYIIYMLYSGHFNIYSPSSVTTYCIDHAKETQEPIFPPELKLLHQNDIKTVILKGPRATWYRPTSLSEILRNEKKNKFLFEIPSRIL